MSFTDGNSSAVQFMINSYGIVCRTVLFCLLIDAYIDRFYNVLYKFVHSLLTYLQSTKDLGRLSEEAFQLVKPTYVISETGIMGIVFSFQL